MAVFTCNWDNSAVISNSNAISQRLSWREKSLGGVFNTTNVTPSNDMSIVVNSATFNSALTNKIYEFKLEAICSVEGPVINSNGILENIRFSCILPEITPTSDTLDFFLDLSNTDITKVRLKLKLQSDNSTIITQTINRVLNSIDYTFTGLNPLTDYYLEVEYYTTINGIEVISSSVGFLGTFCGGNVAGYAFSTLAATTTTTTSSTTTTTTTPFLLDSIYVGAKATSAIPNESEILLGNFSSQNGSLDVTADWTPFNSSPQYLWWAIPDLGLVYQKDSWYESILNNGNMGNPGDLFETISTVNVGGQDYLVGITAYQTQFFTTCLLLKI